MASPTPVRWLLSRVWGRYWGLCGHRSHRRRLPCLRLFLVDNLCWKHWNTCYAGCEDSDV